jgi:alanine racemase
MSDGFPLRLTIDLGALRRNWLHLAKLSAPADCAAVVKADAYGIGIEAVVPALRNAGCRTFFVALPEEGRRTRLAAPDADVYVLSGFLEDAADLYFTFDMRPVLNSPNDIDAWIRHGDGRASALHVDTGMNRLGLSLHEAIELASRSDRLAGLNAQLLVSHLACADSPDHPLNPAQLALYRELRGQFPGCPGSLANSAGIVLGRDFHFDLVRPGIALYGAAFAENHPPLETVVTLEAQILQVREAAAGESVGYGAAEALVADTRIAIVSAGYADGYSRGAGSRDGQAGARVFLRGRTARLLGRVSMDLIAVDVTDIPGVTRGGWVELFGPNMPIEDVAEAAGTIAYELLTGLSRRASRTYVGLPEIA